jgi:hypothetical protein
MKGFLPLWFLPWLVPWARRASTRDFNSALAALDCTSYGPVDFLIVPSKYLNGWGGGGEQGD